MCLCVWREGDKKDDSYISIFSILSSKIKLTWLVAGVHPYVVNPEAPYSAIRGTAAGSLSLSADQDIIMELGREAVVSIYGRRRAANCSTG